MAPTTPITPVTRLTRLTSVTPVTPVTPPHDAHPLRQARPQQPPPAGVDSRFILEAAFILVLGALLGAAVPILLSLL